MKVSDKPTAEGPHQESGGSSRDQVRRAGPERDAAVDEALGLQMISIRLQKSLIEDLKALAHVNGIGYQPLIRDVLHRFVDGEMKNIVRDIQIRRKEEQDRIAKDAKLADEAAAQAETEAGSRRAA